MVESLTSYVTRLAQAHDVSTRTLIADYLRFRMPKKMHLGADLRYDEWKRHFLDHAHTLNGMTDRVEDWIFALEESTGVANLRYATMVPWKGIFSDRGLLRSRRAWCAFCYHDWQASGEAIYEPLLWAVADLSTCHVHQRTLTESCPHCRCKPVVLTPRSRPGCCTRCHHWLGSDDHQETVGSDPGSVDTRNVSAGIGLLLVSPPLLRQPPSKDVMWGNLEGCIRDLAGGNVALFGRAAGPSAATLVHWFAGRKLPSFASLNRLCFRLGIPLFRFLTETLIVGDPDWKNARRILGQHEKHVQSIRSSYAALRRRESAPAKVNHREIKRALQCALRENPLPTVGQIACRLGIRPDRIYRRFPDFHKNLSRARQARLEAAAKAALLESPPPTLREFEKQQHCNRKTLRICFPGLFRELAVHSAERYHRKRDARESLLRAACAEEPPPSGHALAARLGRARANLKRAFPEIWDVITRRYADYQKQEAARKRAAFSERVRRIVTDLLKAGKYPSRRRVLARLGASELRGESLIVCEVRQVVLVLCDRQESPVPILEQRQMPIRR